MFKKAFEKISQTHNRIFILPTKAGAYFLVITFILFLISLSYGHSLAFTTTFIFVAIVITSAHFTNFNLAGIEVVGVRFPFELFADEDFEVSVTLKNNSSKFRFDLDLSLINNDISFPISLGRGETQTYILKVENPIRGSFKGRRIKISSSFPFGLFRAWKYWNYDFQFCVFPKASSPVELNEAISNHHSKGRILEKSEIGSEEFYGHQNYEEGMPLRSIDWKAYARGRGILLKKFIEQSDGRYIFSKELEKGPLEERLSILCAKVKMATGRGATYALVLDGEKPHFGAGTQYKRQQLKRLALHEKEIVEVGN